MKQTIERRHTRGLEVRRVDGKTTLEGFAVRYGSLSEDLGGFKEVIAQGAFSAHLRTDPNVVALAEHSPARILGRTRAGTLQLNDDDEGVRFTIDPPSTELGRDVTESVRRGDLSGMSFGFRALNDSWATVDGKNVRTVTEGELYDISVVTFPSYESTNVSVAVRSLDRWKKENRMSDVIVDNETTEVDVPAQGTTEVAVPAQETEEVKPPTPERRSAPAQPRTVERVHDPMEWRDARTGLEVRVLKPGDKFADLHRNEEPLSLGRAVRAMVTGTWEGAEAEQRALSTTANPQAGILVPDSLSASVIDLARARSVLVKAGAKTVSMPTGTMKIARVSEDPTMEVHTENVAFSGSDVVFDTLELTAYTIGTYITLSRELVSDAPNSVQLIEQTLAKALAAKLDWYGLQGTGSQMPLGLVNFAGTNSDAVGGSVDYGNILTGIMECEVDNFQPNAFILSPANADVLRQLLTNSEANHYATPPLAAQALTTLVTTGMPNATAAVGDFSQFIIGLRQGATVEVTTTGGSSFDQHSVFVKVSWRGTFATTHREAFCLLTGIS